MHIILTGATGLVGSAALRGLLTNPSVTKISILSRRPVPQAEGQEKADVIIHKDYENYGNELHEKFKDATGVVWAQGISQTQVEKEEYIKITRTYPLSFAEFLLNSPNPNLKTFVYVSGEGANHNPGRLTPLFGVVKGQIEQELLALGSSNSSRLSVYIARPGGVDPTAQTDIHPFIPKVSGLMGAARGPLLSALRLVYKNGVNPTKELGEALVELAGKEGEELKGEGIEQGRIVTCLGLRRMSGL